MIKIIELHIINWLTKWYVNCFSIKLLKIKSFLSSPSTITCGQSYIKISKQYFLLSHPFCSLTLNWLTLSCLEFLWTFPEALPVTRSTPFKLHTCHLNFTFPITSFLHGWQWNDILPLLFPLEMNIKHILEHKWKFLIK